jgi:PhzF family phenazine biosynthesis protein
MSIEIYQVDAFCRELFSGNPAGVCPLESWPDDALLQKIAMENNLAETAFFVNEGERFVIRWFTPSVEVDLCGHATLAAAHVLFEHKEFFGNTIHFYSPRSGKLEVTRENNVLTLNFPRDIFSSVEVTDEMSKWFSAKPLEAFKGKTDYMLVFPSESDILNINANLSLIETLKEARGVIVTAKGSQVDFVSRFFAPQSGIPEDPVTGSAHTTLTPYWAAKLGKKEMSAIQLSPRKGYLRCRDLGERIAISGNAKTFLVGEIFVE